MQKWRKINLPKKIIWIVGIVCEYGFFFLIRPQKPHQDHERYNFDFAFDLFWQIRYFVCLVHYFYALISIGYGCLICLGLWHENHQAIINPINIHILPDSRWKKKEIFFENNNSWPTFKKIILTKKYFIKICIFRQV